MELTFRTATPAERLYAYEQSTQIAGQCGSPGYLHCTLSQNELLVNFSEWKQNVPSLDTAEFTEAFNHILDLLRFDEDSGPILNTRDSMAAFCVDHPESQMGGSREYAFRADTQDYSCLLRCLPQTGECYIYPYRRDWLDRHMEQAEKGIRFIDPHYKELFRIPDGGQIRVLREGCAPIDRTCRYIDDCHVEVGNGWDRLFHICQFAEQMERCHNRVIPLTPPLPEKCFTVLPSSGELIVIERYRPGYEVSSMARFKGKTPRQTADTLNANMGVNRAQAAAMLAGATQGWTAPAADPKNYDAQGRAIRPRHQDGGDAR